MSEHLTLFSIIQALAMGAALVGLFVLVLGPVALRLRLVDRPGGRKHHTGNIPLIGGPALALMLLTLPLFSGIPNPGWLIMGGMVLVITGIADDRWQLSASFKLLVQLLAAAIAVIGGGAVVTNFGLFFGEDITGSYVTGMVFSVIALTGMINAFNMIDGIDGLAASLATFTLTCLMVLVVYLNGQATPFFIHVCLALIGGLCAFLVFNLGFIPRRKIFLGDSGSMLIGLMVGVLLIKASEGALDHGQRPFPTAMVLWITAVPVMDTVSLIFRRLARGVSPFSPDRTHFHHLIMQAGASPRQTLGIILLVACALAGAGWGITSLFGSTLSIILWAAIFLSYLVVSIMVGRKLRKTASASKLSA